MGILFELSTNDPLHEPLMFRRSDSICLPIVYERFGLRRVVSYLLRFDPVHACDPRSRLLVRKLQSLPESLYRGVYPSFKFERGVREVRQKRLRRIFAIGGDIDQYDLWMFRYDFCHGYSWFQISKIACTRPLYSSVFSSAASSKRYAETDSAVTSFRYSFGIGLGKG